MANILFDVALASTVLVVTAALMLGPANDCRAADADARRKAEARPWKIYRQRLVEMAREVIAA